MQVFKFIMAKNLYIMNNTAVEHSLFTNMLQMVCASSFETLAGPLPLAAAWYLWATCSRLLT